MTPEQIRKIMPNAGNRAEVFAGALSAAMTEFAITTPNRMAAFLANVAHESMQLHAIEENLNYSAQALIRIWPAKFPPQIAAIYARDPERIANRAYASKNGNGDEASGDGWRYRGAGLIQLTFFNNHAACAKHFNMPPKSVGLWLRTPEGAARSAAWFWQSNGLNAYADKGDFDGVCDIINKGRKTSAEGDALGYAERNAFYIIALEVLK